MPNDKKNINLNELEDVNGGYIVRDAKVWRVINSKYEAVGGEFESKKDAIKFAQSNNWSGTEIGIDQLLKLRQKNRPHR